jgi:hypothetical protein
MQLHITNDKVSKSVTFFESEEFYEMLNFYTDFYNFEFIESVTEYKITLT